MNFIRVLNYYAIPDVQERQETVMGSGRKNSGLKFEKELYEN